MERARKTSVDQQKGVLFLPPPYQEVHYSPQISHLEDQMKASASIAVVFLTCCLVSMSTIGAFVASPVSTFQGRRQHQQRGKSCRNILLAASDDQEREKRLKSLGYSDDEIKKANQESVGRREAPKVRVDIVDDVDPLTLTAIGFAAIAFNFLVLGNLGDGGIGGLVATFINLMNQ